MAPSPGNGPRFGLRARLLVLVAAVIAPFAAFHAADLSQSRERRVAEAVSQAQDFAKAGAERYRDVIDDARNTLDLMSHVPAALDGAPEECRAFLETIRRGRPWASAFFRVEPNGRISCATVTGAVGLDVSERPWLRQTLAAGAFTVSAFYVTLVRKAPTSAAALPIAAAGGGPPRVLMANLDLGWLDRLAASIGEQRDAVVLLIDGGGRALARYPREDGLTGKDLSGFAHIKAALAVDEGSHLGPGRDGTQRFYSSVRLAGTDARLIVALDRGAVLAPIDAAITRAALLFCAVTALVAVAIWLMGRRIFVAPLQAMTETLATTLEFMGQGIMMIDSSGRVQVANARAAALLDLPPDFLAARPSFRDLRRRQMEAGEYDRADPALRAWVMSDAMMPIEGSYERTRPNGTVLDIRTARIPDGSIVRTYADITHLKEAERRLRASEALYRLLADNASDVIFVKGADVESGRFYVSPSCRAVLGHEPDAFAMLPTREIIHPDDLAKSFATYARLGAETPSVTSVHRLRHKDGRWIWVEVAFNWLDGEDGGEPRVLGAIRDMTERQAQSQALEQAKEAAERARALAEQANEAKTDFLAAMSHEIRTPLNAVIGFTDLLAESGRLPSALQRHAELARSSGSALLTIVDDILDFAKVEAGAIEIESRSFHLAALVENCVSIVRGGAGQKALSVTVAIDAALSAHLVGDEARLRQILLNLLNNAVKFTAAGSVAVTVRGEGAVAAGERLRFSVSDTGIGIAEDKQHRLFERFSQVDGSIRRDFGGTGLGLAICKRLVALMGGEIGVASQVGRGSTFWITLTLPRGAAAEPHPSLREESARGSGRLLLAEDVEINQELARLVLEAAGHAVTVVGDGAAAVAAVARGGHDLVLMDVQMPGMDGMTATRLIRALPGPERAIPVIAMTANVLPDEVRRFRQAGMNDHVGKPFDRAILHATIARWLPAPALQPPSPAPAAPGASIDGEAFEEIVGALGPPVVIRLLGQLAAQMGQGFDGAPDDADRRAAFRGEAHKLVSAAGMLGFSALSRACARLETCDEAQIARDGGDGGFAAALASVAALRRAAAAEIEIVVADLRRRHAG